MSGIYRARGEEVRAAYRDLLDRWPVPAERLVVPTRHGDTFVVVSGPADAPPVVLVHGSGANTAMWLDDVAEWSREFRVVAVDVLGEPGLSAETRLPLDGPGHAEWFDDVLDALGVADAAFVGVSLGGFLATDYALRSDRVRRLVLLNPGGFAPRRAGFMVKGVLLALLGEWGLRWSIRSAVGAVSPELVEYLVLVFRSFKPRMEPLPVFGQLGLAMPVLAVLGARDAMLDAAATARRLAAEVPHADVRMLPEQGHYITGQTVLILGFLQEEP